MGVTAEFVSLNMQTGSGKTHTMLGGVLAGGGHLTDQVISENFRTQLKASVVSG